MQYIKKCRPLATVQYEQHILYKNLKKNGRNVDGYYKLGKNGG